MADLGLILRPKTPINMAEVIRMPKMSDTMEEGVIASWQKKVGDEVKSGDILAEVETDKATMELESYENGVLLYTSVGEREAVPVDGVIAIIGEKGEDIDDLIREAGQPADSRAGNDADTSEDSAEKEEAAQETPSDDDVDVDSIPATVVTMPKMSDTMTEGVIASWQKKVGDKVESGDILAEVETDKATMELEAYEGGYLLYIGVEEGKAAPIDGIIAIIGEKDADYEKLIKAHKSDQSRAEQEVPSETEAAVSETPKKAAPAQGEPTGAATDSSNGRIKASPLAKKLAADLGYDLHKIKGSGENGRIIKRDVESYEPSTEAAPQVHTTRAEEGIAIPASVGEEQHEDVAVSQMRKTIAKRLAESKFSAPHFYLTMEINMDRVVAARVSLNEISPVKISYNDIILKAAAAALRQHPDVNVSWLGDKIRKNKHIHIGVAVAVEEGLLVPVVRFADNKTLSHIAAEVKQLGEKARNKKLQPEDWEGNTFTISNLGMFGIEEFTAIINPPDACIMAIGGIKEAPVVVDGEIRPGHLMKVTLSCDHRAVDGATGAAFLQTFKGILEDPVRILI
jgi:pyruvate dehydrogenase E2 component (dihydrolipoamide acetyltransferase)